MNASTELQQTLANIDKDIATTEKQAAEQTDAAELGRLGGLAQGLQLRRKAIETKLTAALGIAAAKERAARERVEEAEREAFRAHLADLERQWAELMTDFDAVGAEAAACWTRFQTIWEASSKVYAESQRLGLSLGGYAVGSLSGAAGEAQAGRGFLVWRG